MSAFAGIYFRGARGPSDDNLIADLRNAVQGHGAGRQLTTFSSASALILKFDSGAYGSAAAMQLEGDGLAVLAGHPYVDGASDSDRSPQLGALAAHVARGELRDLSRARGSYCAAFVNESQPSLVLATDCLGTRPLYFLENSAIVIFSTNLKTFELLRSHQLKTDDRGAIQFATLGFSLADRTQYLGVHCLRGGNAITFTDSTSIETEFWKWHGSNSIDADASSIMQPVFDSFLGAVRLRLGSDRRAMAFLTGGLDSRCVVSALRLAGADVNTVNFAPENSLDLVLGARLGKAIGTNHLEMPMPLASVAGKIASVLPRWIAATQAAGMPADHPSVVWSGDGGSVALGHVYLTDAIVDLAQKGQEEEALRLFLSHNTWQIPVGVMRREYAGGAQQSLLEGLREDLAKISCADRGRAFHMLLMMSDQRRHLHDHYERIYQHGCELQLPFFDRDFLATVLGLPVRPFLAHRFYNRWLRLFPKPIQEVPWQAYPKHEPCPVPVAEELSYQWDKSANLQVATAARRALCKRVLSILLHRQCQGTPISAPRLALVWLATSMSIRDYGYALAFAEAVCVPGSKTMAPNNY